MDHDDEVRRIRETLAAGVDVGIVSFDAYARSVRTLLAALDAAEARAVRAARVVEAVRALRVAQSTFGGSLGVDAYRHIAMASDALDAALAALDAERGRG